MLEDLGSSCEIERYLREVLGSVDLVGELAFTESDRQKLAQALRSLSPDRVPQHRSHTLACFLVLVGFRHYREGNYWGAVESALGCSLSVPVRQQWGQAFERVVRGCHLASFADTGGHRYVTPILGHGGIPDYCLSDFFGKLLLPAVTGRLDYEGDVEKLLDEWQSRPSLFEFTDQPVRRFLLYGGKTARDFLQRCLQMADEVAEGEAGDARELGVPSRVVEGFRKWFEGCAPTTPLRRDQHRFRAAELRFEPSASGLILIVPAQRTASVGLQGQEPRLEVRLNHDLLESLQPRSLRCNGMVETTPVELLLRRPFAALEVRLQVGETRLRNWQFEGISRQQPWMAFDGQSGRLIRARPLPKRLFWLLSDDSWGMAPEATGAVRVREESECWGSHIARLVELDRPGDICLQSREDQERRVAVQVNPEIWAEPRLEGGSPIAWPSVRCPRLSDAVIYAGEFPDLVFPPALSNRGSWQSYMLAIRSRLDDTGTERKLRLDELVGEGQASGADLRLSLSHPLLLGADALGVFTIRLRGRLGHDAAFDVCVLPPLSIELPYAALVPAGRTAASELSLRLSWGRPVRMRLGEGQSSTPLASEDIAGCVYRVPPSPAQSCIPLAVEIPRPDGVVVVPLQIDVPLLQWALIGLSSSSQLHFGCATQEVFLQELEQAKEATLVVKSPFPRPVGARLVLGHGLQEDVRSLRPGRNEFRLAPFLDTIRSQSSITQVFKLALRFDGQSEVATEVLRVRTEWDVEDVRIRCEAGEQRYRLAIHWRDRVRLRNRLVRLWRLAGKASDRLVSQLDVGDDRSEAVLDLERVTLLDGHYRLEFTLRDEWSPAVPPDPPDPFARNIQDFLLRDTSVECLDSQRRQFEDFLEAICETTFRAEDVIEGFYHPQIAALLPEHLEQACQLCRAVYQRWRNGHENQVGEGWDRDCLSLVGRVFSLGETQTGRLLEAVAEAARREAELTRNEELAGWWLQALAGVGALQRPWDGSTTELVKRSPMPPMSDQAAPAGVSLPEVYRAATWSRPDIAATFLENLRRVCKRLLYGNRTVRGIEYRPFEEWPLVIHYRAKRQCGVPRGVRMSDTGTAYLEGSSWYRLAPRDWSEVVERFVLSRFQRALAWGVLQCSEERYNQIHMLGGWFCARFGPAYLRALLEAEHDLRKWVRAAQEGVRHEP